MAEPFDGLRAIGTQRAQKKKIRIRKMAAENAKGAKKNPES